MIVKEEIKKLNKAIEKVSDHLDGMYEIALDEFGEQNAEIFLAQKILLNDASLYGTICSYIEEGLDADEAVTKASDECADRLMNASEESIRSKALDIREISKRLLNVINGCLTNDDEKAEELNGQINGDNLTTSDILTLDVSKVSEIVFDKTSEFAHVVILARARGLNVRFLSGKTNDYVEGIVKKTGIQSKKIIRTEYMYMNRPEAPSIEEQVRVYSDFITNEKTDNHDSAIIRLFDLGADKISGLIPNEEVMSFVSKRGIRNAIANEKLLTEQIDSILMASSQEKNISILVPMIATEKEVQKVRELINDSKNRLGLSALNVRLGLMIETPAAVMISDKLALLCDFFILGINDLMQYTYACDRNSKELETIYNENPDSILVLIDMVKKNAEAANISVAVCGN